MARRQRRHATRTWGLVILAMACAPSDRPDAGDPDATVQVCTLIGCASGLGLQIGPAIGDSYRLTVRAQAPAGDSSVVIDCTQGGVNCTRVHMLEDYMPEEVEVTVVSGADTTVVRVAPHYTISQPNGPNCPPTCRQSHLLIGYPDSAA